LERHLLCAHRDAARRVDLLHGDLVSRAHLGAARAVAAGDRDDGPDLHRICGGGGRAQRENAQREQCHEPHRSPPVGGAIPRGRPEACVAARTGPHRTLDATQRPQTSRAVSATRWSLARWSAAVTRVPSIVEAKPHWGDSARRSSGTKRAASSMRRHSSSTDSSRGAFVVTSPSTTERSSGTAASGSKPPERWSSYSRRKRWNRLWRN